MQRFSAHQRSLGFRVRPALNTTHQIFRFWQERKLLGFSRSWNSQLFFRRFLVQLSHWF